MNVIAFYFVLPGNGRWKKRLAKAYSSLSVCFVRKSHALFLILFLQLPLTANAVEPDWPCIQAYVPVVEMGVLWPAVLTDADLNQWKRDDRVAPLARQLGRLVKYTDEERQLVEAFVESTPEGDRTSVLNRLAEGTLTIANGRRSSFMKGIKKYTRQQTVISLQIQDGLNRLAELEEGAAPNSATEKADLAETMEWHQRVFDQREHAMVALCDQPVLVEQLASDVLRDLAQYLP